jgi:hypothetical protein
MPGPGRTTEMWHLQTFDAHGARTRSLRFTALAAALQWLAAEHQELPLGETRITLEWVG